MRSKRILWLALLLFVMTFTILPVSAAETSISVGIPVQVKSGETPAVKGDVLFTLTPVEGAPAPAQSGLRLAAGNGSILPAVTLPKPDTYVYRLQAAPADPSSDYIEGLADFRVEITVFNGDTGMEAVIVASDWNKPADAQPKEPVTVVLKRKILPGQDKGADTAARSSSMNPWLWLAAGSLLLAAVFWIGLKHDTTE